MSEMLELDMAIRDLHQRYVDAVFRKDIDAFGRCFASDCEWRVGGKVICGKDAIVEFMSGVFPQFKRILMTFRSPMLSLANGEATGRTYVTEQSVLADGTGFGPFGIYYERFVKEHGEWRFGWRLFQTYYVGPTDMSGTLFEPNDYGPPPAMPPIDEPTFDRSGVGSRAQGQSDQA